MARAAPFRPAQLRGWPWVESGCNELSRVAASPGQERQIAEATGRGPLDASPRPVSQCPAGGVQPPKAASSSSAIAMLRWSDPGPAATWMPIGKP